MAPRLLITDISTPLGSAILGMLECETFPVIAPAAGEVDWSDAAAVKDLFSLRKPDIVINTLGWSDSGSGLDVKRFPQWVANITAACELRETVLIQLSSYRVFNGEKSEFAETDTVCPIGPSGEAYLAAESIVEKLPRHIVLRLSWVVGWRGDNLLTRLLVPLSAGKNAGIYGERRGAPTALDDVGRVVVALVKQVAHEADNWGIFHYCSSDVTTEYEFANQVLGLLKEYLPNVGGLELLDAIDPLPQSATLSCRRIHDNFGVHPRTWRKGLSLTIRRWLSEQGLINEVVSR